MSGLTEYDTKLLDPHWYTTAEYHHAFRRLRDEDPVHWTVDPDYGKDYWAITRYSDIKEYLLDPRRFSSRWDTRVPRSPKRRTPEERYELGYDVDVTVNDDPIHDLYRRPVNKYFSTPAIAKLSDEVDTIVDEIIAEVAGTGECDLVEDLAGPLPMKVILRMLGVPPEDWEELRVASWRMLAAGDPRWMIDGDELATHLLGRSTMLEYCTKLALQRRKEPRDDFATVISNIRIDGDLLSLHELRTWFLVIIAGGLETTRNATGVGLWLFLRNPDQRELLLRDPSLVHGAVEEVLRWTTPTKHRLRIATQDFDYHGKRIRTGDWVVGFLASANKDERVFDDPHRFDIRRHPNEHLSLGSGVHLCLGRALARLEMAALLPKVLATFPDLEIVDHGEPAWIADRSVTGFTSMRLRYTPVDYPAPKASPVST